MSESCTTTDHDEIRRWVEQRGERPVAGDSRFDTLVSRENVRR